MTLAITWGEERAQVDSEPEHDRGNADDRAKINMARMTHPTASAPRSPERKDRNYIHKPSKPRAIESSRDSLGGFNRCSASTYTARPRGAIDAGWHERRAEHVR